jgi:hypothetical protein
MKDDGAQRDSERAAAALEIDPDRSNIVCAIGTKGSGKSEALRTIFNTWPYDRVVIDVTGDARPVDPATVVMTAPVPSQLPAAAEGQARVTAWVRLDPRRPSYADDQDDALGLALYPRHRNTVAWVDEYAQMATANKWGPNLALALQSSRHYHMSMLLAFQRPKTIPVLTLTQADRVFIFDVPIKTDREYIANNIGFEPARFEQRWQETMARGGHSFLLWDGKQKVLIGCPPLPLQQTHGPRA